jgi:hypothetical protein
MLLSISDGRLKWHVKRLSDPAHPIENPEFGQTFQGEGTGVAVPFTIYPTKEGDDDFNLDEGGSDFLLIYGGRFEWFDGSVDDEGFPEYEYVTGMVFARDADGRYYREKSAEVLVGERMVVASFGGEVHPTVSVTIEDGKPTSVLRAHFTKWREVATVPSTSA